MATAAPTRAVAGQSLSFTSDPMRGVALDSRGMRDIADRVARSVRTTTLSLQGNHILPRTGLVVLIHLLRSNATLRNVNLSMCRLDDDSVTDLIRAMIYARPHPSNSKVSRLVLSMNTVSDYALRIVTPLLQKSVTSLRHLVLRYNPVTWEGLRWILHDGSQLRSIDVSYCLLDDADQAGAQAAVHQLMRNTSLDVLVMDGNGLMPETRDLFAAAMRPIDGRQRTVSCNDLIVETIQDYVKCCAAGEAPPMDEKVLAHIAAIDGPVLVSNTAPDPTSQRSSMARSPQRSRSRSTSRRPLAPVDVTALQPPPATVGAVAPVGPAAQQPQRPRSTSRNRPIFEVRAPSVERRARSPVHADPAAPLPDHPSPSPRRAVSPTRIGRDAVPQVERVVDACARLREVRRSTSRATSVDGRARAAAPEPQATSDPKARAVRRLLDECVADDEQCGEILGDGIFTLPGAAPLGDLDLRVAMPPELVEADATPCVLRCLPVGDESRIAGVAKLLFVLHHARTLGPGADPARRAKREQRQHINDDLPVEYRLLPAEQRAAYRSQRVAENGRAKKYIELLMRPRERELVRLARQACVDAQSKNRTGRVHAAAAPQRLTTQTLELHNTAVEGQAVLS